VKPIYFDHHATTPVDPAVLAVMQPYFCESFGNPASRSHALGQEADRAVAEARGQVAELIGAEPREIVFTSGATEANNLAIQGVAQSSGRGHIVTTAIEHASVLATCRALERRGFGLTVVRVARDGIVRIEDVASALRPDTILVSVMAANNEIGTLQPVLRIAELCRELGVPLHCDATQAAGRMPIDTRAWGVDLLSLSAHKVYGPKGVGALYVRRRRPRLTLEPNLYGGGQEGGLRAGTLNVPGIVGMGAACRLAAQAIGSGEPARLAELRARLLAGLTSHVGGIEINGSLERRLPGNLSLSIAGVAAEPLLISLGGRVALSAGAACSEAQGQGSHVLEALGLSSQQIHTAVRFGLGRYNTPAEVDACVEALAQEAAALRKRVASTRPRGRPAGAPKGAGVRDDR
jgi:cysteine desulfurase